MHIAYTDIRNTTGCPAILCTIFLNLNWLFYSLSVNFFSQYPFPLYKRRKMSGQSPLKLKIFDVGEKKTATLRLKVTNKVLSDKYYF